MEKILNDEDKLLEWMTCGRTVLCVKDPTKGNVANNFRPIITSQLTYTVEVN